MSLSIHSHRLLLFPTGWSAGTNNCSCVRFLSSIIYRYFNCIAFRHFFNTAYRNALIRGGVISEDEKKSCILTDTWTRRPCNPNIGDIIEMKLKLHSGSFCKRKSREPRTVGRNTPYFYTFSIVDNIVLLLQTRC